MKDLGLVIIHGPIEDQTMLPEIQRCTLARPRISTTIMGNGPGYPGPRAAPWPRAPEPLIAPTGRGKGMPPSPAIHCPFLHPRRPPTALGLDTQVPRSRLVLSYPAGFPPGGALPWVPPRVRGQACALTSNQAFQVAPSMGGGELRFREGRASAVPASPVTGPARSLNSEPITHNSSLLTLHSKERPSQFFLLASPFNLDTCSAQVDLRPRERVPPCPSLRPFRPSCQCLPNCPA